MATFDEIRSKIIQFQEQIAEDAAHIIAESAVEYFKERFTEKEFNGNPWAETKVQVQRGSLMVRSGALVSSIRPAKVTAGHVQISAGGYKAPYAQIHNEGGIIQQPGGTAWGMVPESKGSEVLKPVWVSNAKARETGKKYPRTKPHSIPIPQRQFMGDSAELNDIILNRINELISKIK